MLKDFICLNNTNINIDLYDKIIDYFRDEFRKNHENVEKHSNSVKVDNEIVEYKVLNKMGCKSLIYLLTV